MGMEDVGLHRLSSRIPCVCSCILLYWPGTDGGLTLHAGLPGMVAISGGPVGCAPSPCEAAGLVPAAS